MNLIWAKKYGLFFVIGAVGYGIIEVIWRGYTHWSMIIAGGLCFVLFSVVSERMKDSNILIKAGVCALGITVVEFVFGLFFNVMLGMRVWDYSDMPLNVMGQICPTFSLMWVGLAILFLPLADRINQRYTVQS